MDVLSKTISNILINFAVPALALAPMVIALLFLIQLHRQNKKRSRYPFDIAALQRMPGQTLLSQFNDKATDTMAYLLGTVYLTLLPLSYYGFARLVGSTPPNLVYFSVCMGIAIAFTIRKIVITKRQQLDLRLGLEAEWFTAIELYNGLPHSYKIFNDIQCDNFNIDHLVIGPNGVFAIETKGRRKPKLKNPKDKDYVVKVNGEQLTFPTYSETDTAQQAMRQAKWAQTWLSQACGFDVTVMPVVNIPGWFIEITSKPSLLVSSTRNLANYLKKANKFLYDEKQVDAIAYQVKQKSLRENDLI